MARLMHQVKNGFVTWVVLILVAGVIAGGWIYVSSAENAKKKVGTLETLLAESEKDSKAKDTEIKTLNDRIKANNARWLEAIERERAQVARAQAEAELVRKQRDRVSAELTNARRRFEEALQDDPELEAFVAIAVPAPVWPRLCSAAGQCE